MKTVNLYPGEGLDLDFEFGRDVSTWTATGSLLAGGVTVATLSVTRPTTTSIRVTTSGPQSRSVEGRQALVRLDATDPTRPTVPVTEEVRVNVALETSTSSLPATVNAHVTGTILVDGAATFVGDVSVGGILNVDQIRISGSAPPENLPAETAARQAADAAIIASGAMPANVGLAPVIAAGTTEARTVAARAADAVNAEDDGMLADSMLSATANVVALQSAFTKAVARGTGVYVPGRGYWFNGKVTIPVGDSNTGIVSPGCTFIWNGSNAAGAVFIEVSGGPTTIFQNVLFQNSINGSSGIPTTAVGATAVWLNQTSYYKSVIRFDRCRFNYWNTGVVAARTEFSAGGQCEQTEFRGCYWVQCHTGVASGYWPGQSITGSNQGDFWGFWHCHWANCIIGWDTSGGAQNYSSLHNCVMTSPADVGYSTLVRGMGTWTTGGTLNLYDCQVEITRFMWDLDGPQHVNVYGGVLSGFRGGGVVNAHGCVGAGGWASPGAATYATGDGATRAFDFQGLVVGAAPPLIVWLGSSMSHVDPSLYTVTPNADQVADPGGTVTFTNAPAFGDSITILAVTYSTGVAKPPGMFNDFGSLWLLVAGTPIGFREWLEHDGGNNWVCRDAAGNSGAQTFPYRSIPGGKGPSEFSGGVRNNQGLVPSAVEARGGYNADPSFDIVFKTIPYGTDAYTFAINRQGRPILTDHGALPAAGASYAGQIWWDAKQGAGNDALYFCCQDNGGAWAWKALF
jgi:hypothetical protein